MLFCIYIIIVEVIAIDVVQSECVPRIRLRVDDEEIRLNGIGYLFCHIENPCQTSQSAIYYKCNVNGENCQKAFAYFWANNSVSSYRNFNRSLVPYYQEDSYIRMRLENVKTADDGIWKINISSTGSQYECVHYNVTTYVRPKEKMRIIPLNVPTYKTTNLTCLVNEMRPAYRLYFEINGLKFRNGIQIDTMNGVTWNISYSVELVLSPIDSLEAQCFIDYDDHLHPFDDWSYSDKFVINPVEDNPLIFNPSEEAVIGCAIPFGFLFIGWMKNNKRVSKSDSFTETRSSEVRGFFDFADLDVTTAQYSELRFVLPNLDHGCDAINEYSGDYACEATHTKLGNSFRSAASHVLVEYAPIMKSTRVRTYDVSTRPDANLIILCPLCSYPPVQDYKWQKQNIQLGNERTLLVPYVTEDDFGQYVCIATNTKGSKSFTVNVIKIVDGKAKLYQATIDDEVTLECPLCDGSENECTWEINGEQIHTGRFYTIATVTEENYGEYICSAVFEGGRSWMRIELTERLNTAIGSTSLAHTVREIESNTAVNMPASEHQEGHLPKTEVIAGFSVVGVVLVGMIVAITIISCMCVRRQQSTGDTTAELSTDATTGEEIPHIYEKINVAFGNNVVYENTNNLELDI